MKGSGCKSCGPSAYRQLVAYAFLSLYCLSTLDQSLEAFCLGTREWRRFTIPFTTWCTSLAHQTSVSLAAVS